MECPNCHKELEYGEIYKGCNESVNESANSDIKEKVKEYEKTLKSKWEQVADYLYAVDYQEWKSKLADETVYRIFKKDIFEDDIDAGYKEIQNGIRVLCELEKYIYFQFDIIWNDDDGQYITNGCIKTFKKIPSDYKGLVDLFYDEQDKELEAEDE